MYYLKYITLPLLLFTSITRADDYIGIIIPPYPKGVERFAAALIDSNSDTLKWSHHIVSINNSNHLWLAKFFERKEKKAYFKVTDQLQLPALKENERIYLGLCKNTKTNENNITGIGTGNVNNEWHIDIRYALRSNTKTKKIEIINIENIICYNEGFGV